MPDVDAFVLVSAPDSSSHAEMAATHPDPSRMRKNWTNLNGEWHFAFDDDQVGLRDKWYDGDLSTFKERIEVPYTFQWEASGIHKPHEIHETVWYARELPSSAVIRPKDDVLLHFGAVDYESTVFVNGLQVGSHTGGFTPSSFDITHALKKDRNVVVVRVFDNFTDLNQPRGKQYWKTQPEGIFYTPTTGIWQTVWLESVPKTRIDAKSIRLLPDIDSGHIKVELQTVGHTESTRLEVEVSCCDHFITKSVYRAGSGQISANISLVQADGRSLASDMVASGATGHLDEPTESSHKIFLWTPESPTLYDVSLKLIDSDSNKVLDQVQSYTGMRKVSVENGLWCLNHKPYFQRLVLDQGYWPKSGMSATDEELKADVVLSKELGFNGCRKHQKLEDPRFLYWADKLGYLVWSEFGNAYNFSTEAVSAFVPQWIDGIQRDLSHPCIVGYVPINESWGVEGCLSDKRQVDYLQSLYYTTKSLVPDALISTNDGWENVTADVLGYHDYSSAGDLAKTWTSVQTLMSTGRVKLIPPFQYQNQPLLNTEYGGVFLIPNDKGGFSKEAVEKLYKEVYERTRALCESPIVQGFVYTQLADCEQEQNGLLTPDRKHKLDPEKARKAITQTSRKIPPPLGSYMRIQG